MKNLILPTTFLIIIFLPNQSMPQWELLNFPSNHLITDIAVDDSNMFVGTWGDGVFLSTDNGANWITVNSGLPDPNVSMLFASNSIVFAISGTTSSVYRSSNTGISWEIANLGLPNIGVWSMVSRESNFFCGTQDSGIYLTTNNGLNWVRTDTGITNNLTDWEPIDLAFNGNRIFAGLSNWGGVSFSDDNAITWDFVLSPYWIHALTVCNGSVFAGSDYHGIFRSTDNGLSWFQVNTGLTNLDISAFTASNSNLFAGSFGGGIFLSVDNGANWNNVNEGLPSNTNVFDLAITNTHIFLSTNNDLWRRHLNEIIPVELVAFYAKINNNLVELNWTTGTETNNQGFEVQRSDGSEFETLAFVKGQGTTIETQLYSYIDKNVISGQYSYRLKQIDYDGTFEFSNVVEVEVTTPKFFSLEQNFPNPFNPSTKIKYSIPSSKFVTLEVYDVLGNEVATLVNIEKPAGSYDVELESHSLKSGVYFYRLQAGSFVETKKMILLK